MRLTLFDRWGDQTGVVQDIVSATHKDELNGEDSLTLTLATCDLQKGDRIVWCDKFGVWHEHIVNDLKDVHEDGKLLTEAYCESSLAEMFTDYIEDLRPYDTTATTALQKALSVTRWEIGECSITGTSSASFYHVSAREALSTVAENWGGELSSTIVISGTQVTARRVNLTSRGSDNGKRFEWRKDLKGITRTVSSDDVCTALYGYGKGLECYDEEGESTGGYGRKLTFGDINGGLDYVADEEAKEKYGLPDGKGGKKHTFGKVEFSDCEDMYELMELTEAELEEQKQPRVSYTATVIDLADAGYDFEDVRTGDTVAIIDRELGERLQGRVLCVERDLFNEDETVITLGNIVRSISDVISSQLDSITSLRDHSAAWDGAASISSSYINGIIKQWNTTMNAVGGYAYYEPGEGIITYDKPEDQDPTMAIQFKGAGFRIANSKTSDGEWNWRTFGTGNGFTADLMNLGTLRGGSNYWNLETGDLYFKQGRISTADGSSYWDMTTGEVSLSSTATIGGSTVGGVLESITTLQANFEFTSEQFSADLKSLTTRVDGTEDDIAALKLTSEQFSVDISSHSETLTQLKAVYCTCTTAGATQAKVANCTGFALRTGAMVCVKFSYANTVANPTLNVNGTGAKAIYLNGSALPEANWWKARDMVTLCYNGTYWYVADGATLTQLASTNTNVANLTLRADAFDVTIKGVQAAYAYCSTAGATQTKQVTISGFTNYSGKAVTVRFGYANTAAEPMLSVQDSSGDVVASGYIYVNNSKMAESYYWKAGETITFVWDGTYWRVGDGGTMSRIKVLEDSITLSVTGSLGSTASIKLSVNGEEQSKTLDLSDVRTAFKNDTTAITITAGTVTFNSNTFVVSSTYFSVTSTGVITAKSGTIGGLTISASSVYNSVFTLNSTGVHFYYSSNYVGKIGTNSLTSDSTKRGLVFDLEYSAAYMCWAWKTSSSANAYTTKLAYAAKSTSNWTADTLHVQCNSNFHNYILKNAYIDPDTGGCNGGISNTLSGMLPTSINSDGTVASWTNNVCLVFKHGMLTKMYS